MSEFGLHANALLPAVEHEGHDLVAAFEVPTGVLLPECPVRRHTVNCERVPVGDWAEYEMAIAK